MKELVSSSRDDSLRGELDALRARIEQFRNQPAGGDSEALLLELESAHEELRVADEEVRAQQEDLDRLIRSQRTDRWMHERLIAVLPAAVLVTDTNGLVHMANGSAAALLGMRVSRLLRKPLFTFLEAADRAQLRRMLVEALGDMRPFRATATVHPRHREPVEVQLAAIPRDDEVTGTTEVTWVLLGGDLPEHGSVSGDLGGHLARSLVELTQLPLSSAATEEVLLRVAETCQRAFAPPVAASISIADMAQPTIVTTDSELARAVDVAQLAAEEGPSREALETSATVSSENLREDDRWPRLRQHLTGSEILSAIAIPVRVGDSTVGILSLYSEGQDLTEPPAVEAAELLAMAVAAVLHEADVKAELETVAEQLETALESRATIDQAKGIIMALYRCGPDEAFERLAQLSSDGNVKLRDLAARMVEKASQGIDHLPDQR